ncbi:hypothetical protein FA13DRAFT_1728703 [Coprinellus micaceus]|uniref:Uncharacterized protein n=1 Tax=Coprinellus micaceus TaxID=71717 RepID=A0A4Y7TKV3_COPMI|nr:hypothetical protein FA13DRAFT_1728703 [Coprinellus micaceus]
MLLIPQATIYYQGKHRRARAHVQGACIACGPENGLTMSTYRRCSSKSYPLIFGYDS